MPVFADGGAAAAAAEFAYTAHAPSPLHLACFVPMLGFLLQTLVSGGAACLTSCDSVRWELFYENGKKSIPYQWDVVISAVCCGYRHIASAGAAI